MKTVVVVFFAFFFIFSGKTTFAAASAYTFSRNLQLGAYGEDVRQLQMALNADPATQIASTGPGSPGQETYYFGGLTRSAVIRFQEKYSERVLYPRGLAQGTGIVGPATRTVLNSTNGMAGAESALGPQVTSTVSGGQVNESAPTTSAKKYAINSSANPNLQYIDTVFATFAKVGAQKGMSPAAIAQLNQKILEEASATTTDMRVVFLKKLRDDARQRAQAQSFMTQVLATLSRPFESFFIAEEVHAQGMSMDTPFGGNLYFTFPCTCSSNGDWFVVISPLEPSYVAILETALSVGQYANYSIPFTPALLGFYSNPPNGCEVGFRPYCVPVPVEGQITSETGSA